MDKDGYSLYSYDHLEPGKELKIDHTIYCDALGIPDLIAQTPEDLVAMRDASAAAEQVVFDKLVAATTEWEKQAVNTMQLNRAIEYVKTPAIEHTGNLWKEGPHSDQEISNMVYHMGHHVYEDTKYNRETQKSEPVAWRLSWSIHTQNPGSQQHYRSGEKIAGQDRKVFTDKAVMEKYLAGRKAAYADYFTEISPPIPKEYERYFKVNGQLLPGYTMEGEAPQRSAPTKGAGGSSLRESLKNKEAQAREQNIQPAPDKSRTSER